MERGKMVGGGMEGGKMEGKFRVMFGVEDDSDDEAELGGKGAKDEPPVL